MASTGCGKTPTLKDGTQTIQSSGQNRSYMIRIPKNYDNNHPYWLIFGFHWVGGTANDVDSGGTSGYTWSYYGLREQADNSTQYQAIFVAPQGISNGWGNSGNQDVVFTDDMIKKVEGDLCVDTKHVFSTGFSYGGGMTKALGCQRPNVFRAIAVYSGADFLSGGCDNTTTSPIAFFGSHSITDPTNPYSSGITILNRFAMNDGCTAQTPPQPLEQPHPRVHEVPGLQVRIPGRMVRLQRRRPHPRARRRRQQRLGRRRQDLDQGRGLEVLHAVLILPIAVGRTTVAPRQNRAVYRRKVIPRRTLPPVPGRGPGQLARRPMSAPCIHSQPRGW